VEEVADLVVVALVVVVSEVVVSEALVEEAAEVGARAGAGNSSFLPEKSKFLSLNILKT
jgi:hypothetical protein